MKSGKLPNQGGGKGDKSPLEMDHCCAQFMTFAPPPPWMVGFFGPPPPFPPKNKKDKASINIPGLEPIRF